MSNKPDEFKFKITVIGDGRVGKTSLIQKFTQGSFQKDYIRTIGAQFSQYVQMIDGDKVNLFFWDIAGQDEFFFLRPTFYQESRAALIVYSLEKNELGKKSLNNIANWHNEIKKYCGEIPVILLGNKVDLVNRENLDYSKISKLLKKRGFLEHFTTSALTGESVIKAFQVIINELYYKYKKMSDKLDK